MTEKIITNLKENKSENDYDLISVYNMVYRVHGKELAYQLNENKSAKKAYHERIYSFYANAKSKGWYGNALKAKFNLPSSHGGDKDNTNTKYVKWWLKKQVTKHNPLETISYVSENA